MKLPKNIAKNKDGEYILTDKTGKKWNLDRINGIIEEIREREAERKQKEDARWEREFARKSRIHLRKRLKLIRKIIK